MSVQYFRILICVVCAHLVIVSAVWVGFPTPRPRPPATFVYEGTLPADDVSNDTEDIWQNHKMIDEIVIDHFDKTSNLNHWITLRDSSKSLKYDHLGL